MQEKLSQNYTPVEIDVKSPGNFGFISKEKARNNRINAENWVINKAVKKEDSIFHKSINGRYEIVETPETPDEVELPVEVIEIQPDAELEFNTDLPLPTELITEVDPVPESNIEDNPDIQSLPLEEDEVELASVSDDSNNPGSVNEDSKHVNSTVSEFNEQISGLISVLSNIKDSKLSTEIPAMDSAGEGFVVDFGNVIVESKEIEKDDVDTADDNERVRIEIESFSIYRELRDLAEKVNDLRDGNDDDYQLAFEKFKDLSNKFEDAINSAAGAIADDEYRISKKALAQIKSRVKSKKRKSSNASNKSESKIELPETISSDSENVDDIEINTYDEGELIELKIAEVNALKELRALALDTYESRNDITKYQSKIEYFNDRLTHLDTLVDRAHENGMPDSDFEIMKKALTQIKSEAFADYKLNPIESVDVEPKDNTNEEYADNKYDELNNIEATIQSNEVLKGLMEVASAVSDNRANGGLEYDNLVYTYQKLRENVYFDLKVLGRKCPETVAGISLVERALYRIDAEALKGEEMELTPVLRSNGFLKNAINRVKERYDRFVAGYQRSANNLDIIQSQNSHDLPIPERFILRDGSTETTVDYINRIMKLSISRSMALNALSKTILKPNKNN